jgi:LmbE family N-acetylglucosaminyl deacetylase
MKFLNSDYVLCIGAHPDDVEYGMTGTFLKCDETEFSVYVMSSGGDYDKTTVEIDRAAENRMVWSRLTNVSGYIMDTFVKDQAEDSMVQFIEESIHPYIDVVVTTPQQDSHFEHRKINNLGPALCRRSPITLVEYRTPSTLNHWIPNHFENLSEKDYEAKKNILKFFVSQQKAPYFNSNTIDSFHHNFLCNKKGYNNVESYRIAESFQK